jgi:hypothetical protein
LRDRSKNLEVALVAPRFFAMNRPALMGVALLLALAGCTKKTETKTETGSITVTGSGKGVAMAGVLQDGKLIYAFAWPVDVPKLDTNDASQSPATKGIHFLYTAPDGLWFDGKKIAIPSKVFAILRDGKADPIPVSEAELQQVTELTRPKDAKETVPDGPLKEKLLAPFKAGPDQ